MGKEGVIGGVNESKSRGRTILKYSEEKKRNKK